MGVRSTLVFKGCAVSTFRDFAQVASLPGDLAVIPYLFGNNIESRVSLEKCELEMPRAVRTTSRSVHRRACNHKLALQTSCPRVSRAWNQEGSRYGGCVRRMSARGLWHLHSAPGDTRVPRRWSRTHHHSWSYLP
jgi:hypothetical protein